MRYGRNCLNRLILCALGISALFPGLLANSENDGLGGGNADAPPRYDGVRVEAMPRPERAQPPRKARAVWTTMGDQPSFPVDPAVKDQSYDWYVQLSDQPYESRRLERMWEAARNRLLRTVKRYGRRSLNELFRSGPEMDTWEYSRRMEDIERISRDAPRWAFQHDASDPRFAGRYDAAWDDVSLLSVGPLSVNDSGSVDLDVDFQDLDSLWDVDIEDVVVAPAAPSERRGPLIGKQVNFRTKAKVKLSSSRLFKTVTTKSPDTWIEKFQSVPRHARLNLGADFYTDIRRQHYLSTEIEFQITPDLQWATFLNVVLYGH